MDVAGSSLAVRYPVAGETWRRPAYPGTTTISILKVEGDSVTVKRESREPVVLTMAMFLSQGFSRQEEGL